MEGDRNEAAAAGGDGLDDQDPDGIALAAACSRKGGMTFMRQQIVACACVVILLAACSDQTALETDDTDTLSPTPMATETVEPSATLAPTPIPTPAPEPTPTPTPTAFGASVFEDPDSCEHSSGVYRVAFPDSWWWNTSYEHAELGQIDACRFFSLDAFDITTASRGQPVPDGIAISINYHDGACLGFFNAQLSQEELTIDGHPATATEWADAPRQDAPPAYYQYIVDLTPDTACEEHGQFIVASTGVDSAGDYEEIKAMLDRMMSTMQITAP